MYFCEFGGPRERKVFVAFSGWNGMLPQGPPSVRITPCPDAPETS
ncbi:hypothetical protein ET418_05150 [Oryzomonas rubra]|uniref:Uncharacterized protein n=1 Tax=Oryzomonas rubra TaxID=2509454 RepID=A0A5A9XM35_9BACT|nr:hypothetical protein ET418_05150 [Oryzomonas rubra]